MRKRRKPMTKGQVILVCVCIALIVVCGYYMIHWNLERDRILRDNAAFSAMYVPSTNAPSPVPTAVTTSEPTLVPTAVPTVPPTQEPTVVPTSIPTYPPTQAPTTAASAAPAPTEVPTAAPTASPSPTPLPTPTFAVFEVPVDQPRPVDATFAPDQTAAPTSAPTAEPVPYATPDANTIVLALETPPPVQDSFAELLAANPETVGFLKIGDWLSLPVVQRPNDNDFYLDHDFMGSPSIGGTLFLDGSNLLVPEDDSLIVYGHNMKNGTMLAGLSEYMTVEGFKKNAIVHFDTIYQNRTYVPFAVFTASADWESSGFFNFRRFEFDDASFEQFAQKMKELSAISVPIDIRSGDRLLLLVTCEYTHDNGRLIVALRALRRDESEESILHIMNPIKVR